MTLACKVEKIKATNAFLPTPSSPTHADAGWNLVWGTEGTGNKSSRAMIVTARGLDPPLKSGDEVADGALHLLLKLFLQSPHAPLTFRSDLGIQTVLLGLLHRLQGSLRGEHT